jgi:hypothetical protein
MIEVGNAIMENGGTRELEKLLEEAHGGREKRIRRSIFGGTELGREELGYAGDLPLCLKRS